MMIHMMPSELCKSQSPQKHKDHTFGLDCFRVAYMMILVPEAGIQGMAK